MNRNEYLSNKDVSSFISWSQSNLETLTFNLEFKSSKFVPGGIHKIVKGISEVSALYRWKTVGTGEGSLQETQSHIQSLSSRLKRSISINGADQETLQICKEILEWGGNRNFRAGAFPFLSEMADHHPASLNKYLNDCQHLLNLKQSDLKRLSGIKSMNAMLLLACCSTAFMKGCLCCLLRNSSIAKNRQQAGSYEGARTGTLLWFPLSQNRLQADSHSDSIAQGAEQLTATERAAVMA